MSGLVDALVFALPGYERMAADIAAQLGAGLGEVERQSFPDGERYQRICGSVADRDVVLIGATHSDSASLELYDLACAMAKYGARRLDLVVPYFGYSTMERACRSGEVITAKTRARLLSVIPQAARGNRAWFVDLHAEGITHYCEGALAAHHVYAKSALLPVMQAFGGENMVLASTDAGRAKWVESLANELGCDTGIIIKRRLSGSDTAVSAVSCDVRDRHVVIYDDMIRTGGSLMGAARAYRDAGAAAIDVIATHGIFPGDAFQVLQDSGLFGRIACSDSHPRAMALADEGLHIIPLAGVLAERLSHGDD